MADEHGINEEGAGRGGSGVGSGGGGTAARTRSSREGEGRGGGRAGRVVGVLPAPHAHARRPVHNLAHLPPPAPRARLTDVTRPGRARVPVEAPTRAARAPPIPFFFFSPPRAAPLVPSLPPSCPSKTCRPPPPPPRRLRGRLRPAAGAHQRLLQRGLGRALRAPGRADGPGCVAEKTEREEARGGAAAGAHERARRAAIAARLCPQRALTTHPPPTHPQSRAPWTRSGPARTAPCSGRTTSSLARPVRREREGRESEQGERARRIARDVGRLGGRSPGTPAPPRRRHPPRRACREACQAGPGPGRGAAGAEAGPGPSGPCRWLALCARSKKPRSPPRRRRRRAPGPGGPPPQPPISRTAPSFFLLPPPRRGQQLGQGTLHGGRRAHRLGHGRRPQGSRIL